MKSKIYSALYASLGSITNQNFAIPNQIYHNTKRASRIQVQLSGKAYRMIKESRQTVFLSLKMLLNQGSKCPSLPGLTHWVNPGLPGLGFKPYFGKVENTGE